MLSVDFLSKNNKTKKVIYDFGKKNHFLRDIIFSLKSIKKAFISTLTLKDTIICSCQKYHWKIKLF